MKMEINVKGHGLVPEHILLKDKEKADLLANYHISVRSLPKIFVEDPAIANLSVKQGDVIKVIRSSKSAGVSVYYRVVING